MLMACVLAGLYTLGGAYKACYTVRPVYKFSKWGPLHVRVGWVGMKTLEGCTSLNQPISGITARLPEIDNHQMEIFRPPCKGETDKQWW